MTRLVQINAGTKPLSADPPPLSLTRRNIALRPSRYGLAFILLLAGLLAGAVNYGNNLCFLMAFLIGTMGLTSALHGYRNLAGLTVAACGAEPVFAGETAHFELMVHPAAGGSAAVRLAFSKGGRASVEADLAAGGARRIRLAVMAPYRGVFSPGPLEISSEFPFGLWHAASRIRLECSCLVYPRPADGRSDFTTAPAGGDEGDDRHGSGSDDFQGLRPYRPGDSPQHISWKASSRGQGLFTKEFSGTRAAAILLDWETLNESAVERRLSVLCRQVLDAHDMGLAYGLRLPERTLYPAGGEAQRRRCLEALARHGLIA